MFDLLERENIHPSLFEARRPEELKRSSNEIGQSRSLTAYLLVDRSVGLSGQLGSFDMKCGAMCEGCYLIKGGDILKYVPPVDEVAWMIENLSKKRVRVILTGAELLARPDLFKAGLLNQKEYLLTSGYIIANKPGLAMKLIASAGIKNVQMSWHEFKDGGVRGEIVLRALEIIKNFNVIYQTNIGVVLNITVDRRILAELGHISERLLDLGTNGLRFNRYKSHGGVGVERMLDDQDNLRFMKTVRTLRKQYDIERTGIRISISGDFGSVSGQREYHCPAGVPGGEITILPSIDGKHRIYPCLEVRNENLLIGYFYGTNAVVDKGNRGKIKLKTRPFLNLAQDSSFGGCMAFDLLNNSSVIQKLSEKLKISDFDWEL